MNEIIDLDEQKPWTNYQEQLALLQQRGMSITDDEKAISYLQRIGYYRLSGYWHIFKKIENKKFLDEFILGTNFQDVLELYLFDKKLRLLILDAVERIEIALRSEISYLLGEKSIYAHMDKNYLSDKFTSDKDRNYPSKTKHEVWLDKQNRLVNESREDYILHNKKKYGMPLKIWVSCQVWDFGLMSKFFEGMLPSDQLELAKRYDLEHGYILTNWLHDLNILRNISAHHSRLWNKNLRKPKLPNKKTIEWVEHFADDKSLVKSRVFLKLYMLKHMLDIISPNSSWWDRVKQLLMSFPEFSYCNLDITRMGIPLSITKRVLLETKDP
ncbi:Abi family protein [Thiotrichales bacterium 19X7-9]|nr:Abi family protein [Thiotrichales bacterium 19X7-9]